MVVIDIFLLQNCYKMLKKLFFFGTLLTIWQNSTINYIPFRFNIVFLQPKKC